MKEKLIQLHGFIEQQLVGEQDWYVQKLLRDKLKAINTILIKLPFSAKDMIEEFEKEIL